MSSDQSDGGTREHLGSRMGFILLSAGCAVGLGNVWKFPYIVGQNGGGLFVAVYLLFLVLLGVPLLCMEFSIGRGSRSSPLKMMRTLEPEGSRWHLHGSVCFAGVFLLMMFYCVVAGWMLYYFVLSVAGGLEGKDSAEISDLFTALSSDLGMMTVCTLAVVLAGFLLCSFGLQRCLEKVTKVMMVATFLIMAVLVIHSLTLDGAAAGIEFYLLPDLDAIGSGNLWSIVVAAMSQAFFTLSIGIGSMAVFGSYIDKRKSLLGEASIIAGLDTLVAVMAGLIIFPACFTYGVDVGSGPSLIFQIMPNVFNALPLGRLWGSMFFLFMCFAAFSTCLALFEAQISCVMEVTHISRRRACAAVGPVMFLLTMPCILGFSVWSGFSPLGDGSTVLDLEDFVLSYLLLPLGALVIALFCTSRYGWGWKGFTDEANAGEGLKVRSWARIYLTYILPLMVLLVFVTGLMGFA